MVSISVKCIHFDLEYFPILSLEFNNYKSEPKGDENEEIIMCIVWDNTFIIL